MPIQSDNPFQWRHYELEPGTDLRDLRELSRNRTSLVAERSRLKNRIQKILEEANINWHQ
jgi:hypothetical protein